MGRILFLYQAIQFIEDSSNAACLIRLWWGLQLRIAVLSIIGEICYRTLGRGDTVGAGRKLPAHPRVFALSPLVMEMIGRACGHFPLLLT